MYVPLDICFKSEKQKAWWARHRHNVHMDKSNQNELRLGCMAQYLYEPRARPLMRTRTYTYIHNYHSSPSFRRVSLPHGSPVKQVKPPAGSQLFRPLNGPGDGTFRSPAPADRPCLLTASLPAELCEALLPLVARPSAPPRFAPVASEACFNAFRSETVESYVKSS
jgi:hypothetical protein